MDYKLVKSCRICGSKRLKKYLDLGNQPLPNNLITPYFPDHSKYPLQVLFCESCSLSHLSIVVNPKLMFSNYFYHSSVSKTFMKHCYELGKKIKKIVKSHIKKQDLLVIDIASNDGCLLEQFKRLGYYVIGVEPAKNLAEECKKKNISVVNEFWSDETAKRLPACDVITATNVLAHVDDISGFLKICANKLRIYTKGILVVEVPYLFNLLNKNQFDTIYHEHLSYFLFKPLKIAFEKQGLNIFKVEQPNIHGGSLRIYASPYSYPKHKSVKGIERFEKLNKLHDFLTYSKFSGNVNKVRNELVTFLKSLRSYNKKVLAYGASAKGISLLNFCEIDNSMIRYIIDDTYEKQYKQIPGSRIQIVPRNYIEREKPDYILLLAWNFMKEIVSKVKFNGKWIIPIPKVVVK